MYGTIFSSVLALVLGIVTYNYHQAPNNWQYLDMPFLFLSTIILVIQGLAPYLICRPLQQAELTIAPRLIDLYGHDPIVIGISRFLLLFPLLTLSLIIGTSYVPVFYHPIFYLGWLVLFGLALDSLLYKAKHFLHYLNPHAVIKMCNDAARRSIQNEEDIEVCEWLDALSETALIALGRSHTILASESLQNMAKIMEHFLRAATKIGHLPANESHSIEYTLSYFFQRVELINNMATEKHFDSVCITTVLTLAKVSLYAAKCDISLTEFPLFFLGKCALHAQSKDIKDIGEKTIAALVGVGKAIPEEMDITFLELKDTYRTLLAQMQQIAQGIFKKNKDVSFNELAQPFRDLQHIFTTDPKLTIHQDTPAILATFKQIQGEFSALENVMNSIPPIPRS